MNPNKAPGPDGFNSFFFKRCWPIVGKDILAGVHSFFTSGKLLGEVNSTFIALVPKVANPTKVSDFRPISCCNTLLYKCITKLIANRIKHALPSLISPGQSAFIQGRSLSDNIILAQELMRN